MRYAGHSLRTPDLLHMKVLCGHLCALLMEQNFVFAFDMHVHWTVHIHTQNTLATVIENNRKVSVYVQGVVKARAWAMVYSSCFQGCIHAMSTVCPPTPPTASQLWKKLNGTLHLEGSTADERDPYKCMGLLGNSSSIVCNARSWDCSAGVQAFQGKNRRTFRLLISCQNTLWKVIQHGLLFRGMGRVATCQNTKWDSRCPRCSDKTIALWEIYDCLEGNIIKILLMGSSNNKTGFIIPPTQITYHTDFWL